MRRLDSFALINLSKDDVKCLTPGAARFMHYSTIALSSMPKHARRLPLKAEYHDGVVEAVEVGPRREVVISVQLDPVWNDGDSSTRRLHFSAIQNYEEVAAFFRRASPAPADGGGHFVDEVIGIVLVAKGIIGIDLDFLGYVELRGAKVREL